MLRTRVARAAPAPPLRSDGPRRGPTTQRYVSVTSERKSRETHERHGFEIDATNERCNLYSYVCLRGACMCCVYVLYESRRLL